jgi:hypothetical protein
MKSIHQSTTACRIKTCIYRSPNHFVILWIAYYTLRYDLNDYSLSCCLILIGYVIIGNSNSTKKTIRHDRFGRGWLDLKKKIKNYDKWKMA